MSFNPEFMTLDADLAVHSKLDDEPNDIGGLTSAELKDKFDEAALEIQRYINDEHIPELRDKLNSLLSEAVLYADQKVIQIGTGDMGMAVYDPYHKQRDAFGQSSRDIALPPESAVAMDFYGGANLDDAVMKLHECVQMRPYVKLKTVTLDTAAAELELDIRDIDLNKFAELIICVEARASTGSSNERILLKFDGAVNYYNGIASSSDPGGMSTSTYLSSILCHGTEASIQYGELRLKMLPGIFGQSGIFSYSLSFSRERPNYTPNISRNYGLATVNSLSEITAFRFSLSSKMAEGSRFRVYGVML